MHNNFVLKVTSSSCKIYFPRRIFKLVICILSFSSAFTYMYAQEASELIRQITPESNESKRTEADTNKEFKVSETQKKLIRKVLISYGYNRTNLFK